MTKEELKEFIECYAWRDAETGKVEPFEVQETKVQNAIIMLSQL